MRWRRWRHRDDQGHARADEAVERSSEKLASAQRKDATAERLANRIRTMREHNHLAEAVADALKGDR